MDTCIYCESTVNVYLGRCEECAVVEFDNDNAHGLSPFSQTSGEALAALRTACPTCS